ncbi:MAG: PAS domain-containing sensor histidine kinase [Bacteroidota bacterium]
MPLRPLLFGSVPIEGQVAERWEEVESLAKAAEAVVVNIEATEAETLLTWLRETPHRPATVLLVPPGTSPTGWLESGADELVTDPARLGDALDRALARTTARARTDRYRLLVEHTLDIVSVVDGFGRYVYASPSIREHLGLEPNDLIGTNAFEGVHPDDVESTMNVFLEAIGTPGSARAMEYRYRAADGSYRHLEGFGRALVGPDGEPLGIINSRDVTERAETDRALRESEARYRTLLEALPDVISRIRRDGLVLDFHVPPVFATEFPADALLGKKLPEVIPDDIAQLFTDSVAKADPASGPVTYRYAVDQADGRLYREARIVPYGPDEVLSILRDVTAEVEAELSLRVKKAELETSQAELRALTAHLQDVREDERAHLSREVHDTLGQQLTAIRYAVGWFGRRLADDEDAQRRLADARALIDETIARVRRIAADLRPGVLDDFGLGTALEWFGEHFEKRTGIVVAVTASGDLASIPDEIATAAFRIAQEALTNVARHAEAETVCVAVEAEANALCVTIDDDGVGLDPSALDGRRSLGVLGMRERARGQGGVLSIEGDPGDGTTVSVTFPLPPPDPA